MKEVKFQATQLSGESHSRQRVIPTKRSKNGSVLETAKPVSVAGMKEAMGRGVGCYIRWTVGCQTI